MKLAGECERRKALVAVLDETAWAGQVFTARRLVAEPVSQRVYSLDRRVRPPQHIAESLEIALEFGPYVFRTPLAPLRTETIFKDVRARADRHSRRVAGCPIDYSWSP